MVKKPISIVQLILTTVFVSCLLVSNIITSKQVLLPFNIVMTGAIFIFPVTYTLSDLFSEVYGYNWSRFTCYLAFSMNLFMVIIFSIVIKTKAPSYWQNQEAFELVLGNSPRILTASLLAFVLGDFINDKVFSKMKQNHADMKGFGLRAIISSLFGELVDSLIFIPLAFIGQMPLNVMLVMGITQIAIKVSYEIVILPITKFVTKKVWEYENNDKKTATT